MKKIIYILLILNAALSHAAPTGSFTVKAGTENGPKKLVCYVPEDYSDEKSRPLIIALQPGGNTAAESMFEMMFPAAFFCEAILICPDDQPQYDGKTIQPAIDYAFENYNIDPDNIVITGYSAGGNHTFIYAMNNPDKIRGIIGIAPSIKADLDYEKFKSTAVCFIVGMDDALSAGAAKHAAALKALNYRLKLILKPGVGHYSSDYFYGDDFTIDWIECWEFIRGGE